MPSRHLNLTSFFWGLGRPKNSYKAGWKTLNRTSLFKERRMLGVSSSVNKRQQGHLARKMSDPELPRELVRHGPSQQDVLEIAFNFGKRRAALHDRVPTAYAEEIRIVFTNQVQRFADESACKA